MIKQKLVLIHWIDSVQPISEWRMIDEIPSPAPVDCVSIGWILGETKKAVSLACSLGIVENDSRQASGVVTIAKKAIIKTKEIKNYD
jgi:hypothetical protein